MEPLNDQELSHLLRQWRAPQAPASLQEKFFPLAGREPWWRWLLNGSIRVPVPAFLAAMMLLLAVFSILGRKPAPPPRAVTLADFQPVKQLQIRIIRSTHEGN
jgi:hypothetical protein